MLQINVEARTFFSDLITKHCGGDRAVAENVPAQALKAAALEIRTQADAERFLAGMAHWVRGRRPRKFDEVVLIARSNMQVWMLEKNFPSDRAGMWEAAGDALRGVKSSEDPHVAYKQSAAIGAQLKAGKNPAEMAALVKKALLKKVVTM